MKNKKKKKVSVKLIGCIFGVSVLAVAATIAYDNLFQNKGTSGDGTSDEGTIIPEWDSIDPSDWDKWCDINSAQTSISNTSYKNKFYEDKPEYNYGICANVLKLDYGAIDGGIVSATSGNNSGDTSYVVTDGGNVWKLSDKESPSRMDQLKNIVKVNRLFAESEIFFGGAIEANFFLDADGKLWASGDGRINGAGYDVAEPEPVMIAGQDDPIVDVVSIGSKTSDKVTHGGDKLEYFVLATPPAAIALTASGKILAWGLRGQCANGLSSTNTFIITECEENALGQKTYPAMADGHIFREGLWNRPTPVVITDEWISKESPSYDAYEKTGVFFNGRETIKKIGATYTGFYALTENETVYGWGYIWGYNSAINGSTVTSSSYFHTAARLDFSQGPIIDIYPTANGLIVKNSDGDFYGIGTLSELGIQNTSTSGWEKLDWAKDVVDITASNSKPLFVKDNGEVFQVPFTGEEPIPTGIINGIKVFSRGASNHMVIDEFGHMYQTNYYNSSISNSEDIPAGTFIRTIGRSQ